MDKSFLQALEAILFASTKPIDEKEIKALLLPYFENPPIKEGLHQLQEGYVKDKRAFRVGKVAGGYLLETIPEVAPYIASLFETKKGRLSKGALEVLSIITFKQPITRSEIEAIRGVDSSSHVETLLEGEWIVSMGKKEVPGRPLLFGTTEKFLIHFGLNSCQELQEKVAKPNKLQMELF